MSSEDAHIIKYIKTLKDVATSLIASCSGMCIIWLELNYLKEISIFLLNHH